MLQALSVLSELVLLFLSDPHMIHGLSAEPEVCLLSSIVIIPLVITTPDDSHCFFFLFVSKEFGPKQWLGEMWQKNLWLFKEAMSSQKQTSQCSRLARFGRESLRDLVIFRYLLKWQQGAPTLPLLHSITFCFYFPCVVLP